MANTPHSKLDKLEELLGNAIEKVLNEHDDTPDLASVDTTGDKVAAKVVSVLHKIADKFKSQEQQ
jgi:hypothetical protein